MIGCDVAHMINITNALSTIIISKYYNIIIILCDCPCICNYSLVAKFTGKLKCLKCHITSDVHGA